MKSCRPEILNITEVLEEVSSDKRKNLLPLFDLCTDKKATFSLLKLQCGGFTPTFGQNKPFSLNISHQNLCLQTVKLAQKESIDLLLTPEYSFPLDLLEEILTEPSMWPSIGKIWCLGCQGESDNGFSKRLSKWRKLGALVISQSFDQAAKHGFTVPVIFAFQLSNQQLCVVIQLKTLPMSDQNCQHEGADLTLGSIIYRFGDNSSTKLYCLICADIMNRAITLSQFFPQSNDHIVILHPQLNPFPKHTVFEHFKQELFLADVGRNTIYITANWSTEVIKKMSKGKNRFPQSAIYCKATESSKNSAKSKEKSKTKRFSYDNQLRLNIWIAQKKANLQHAIIHKTCAFLYSAPVTSTKQLIIKNEWLVNKDGLPVLSMSKEKNSFLQKHSIAKWSIFIILFGILALTLLRQKSIDTYSFIPKKIEIQKTTKVKEKFPKFGKNTEEVFQVLLAQKKSSKLNSIKAFIEVYNEEKDTWLVLDDGGDLSSQDQYRIFFHTFEKVYAYVFQIDTKGNLYWIFPQNDSPFSEGENPISKKTIVRIPKGDVFRLDNSTGKEHIYFCVTQEPCFALASALAKADALVNAERGIGEKMPLKRKNTEIQKSKRINSMLTIKRWFNHVEPNEKE